jgi:hypothetical protein
VSTPTPSSKRHAPIWSTQRYTLPGAGFGDVEFYPDIYDRAEEAMVANAAGQVNETWTAAWLNEGVRLIDQG